jgi:DNA-binding LytR/AlgR family response regulator
MYAVVFAGSFLVMLQQLAERQRELEQFRNEKEKVEKGFLELVSNRQIVRIYFEDIIYIESLSDYIKVHLKNQIEITSKEKISTIAEKLPENFLRIHRSFVVNIRRITRFNSNEVELNNTQLNIGRSYKKQTMQILKST